jgi:hypothetical protein
MSVVRGARPVRNSYITPNVSADEATSTWLWLGSSWFSAPAICRASFPIPHTASVGTPPGGAAAGKPSMFT